MDFCQDLHVHTELSSCAKRDAFPQTFLDLCPALNIHTIGFSNHLWDAQVPGASRWYEPQDMDHILKIKEQLPEPDDSLRILIGCEAEFLGGTHVSLSVKNAKKLDYALISASHFHMEGFVRPKEVQTPDQIRELLLQRFIEAAALDLGIPTGIAHPFCPHGWRKCEQEVLSGISDADYRVCLSLAAKNRKSIEIHAITLGNHLAQDENGFSIEYMRMLKTARQCGCTFHLGSDAHTAESLKIHAQLVAIAKACGITDNLLSSF